MSAGEVSGWVVGRLRDAFTVREPSAREYTTAEKRLGVVGVAQHMYLDTCVLKFLEKCVWKDG